MVRFSINTQAILAASAPHAIIHPIAIDAVAGSELRDARGVVIAIKEPMVIGGEALALWQPTAAWPKAQQLWTLGHAIDELLGIGDAIDDDDRPSTVMAVAAPVAPPHAVSKRR